MKRQATFIVKNLTKSFYSSEVPVTPLKDINALFLQGQSYSIMGISGSGKSTLLSLLAGLDKPTAGTIYFDNKDLSLLSPAEQSYFLAHEISIVFQKPYLLQELTVLENVILKGLIQNKSFKDCQKKGQELLDLVGLLDKKDYNPLALSGGEQQRVSLARALFSNPTFLLADEPTAHLDHKSKSELMSLLVSLCRTNNMGLILSTHDREVASYLDIILYISEGTLIRHSESLKSQEYLSYAETEAY